jgi:hypothetical protein
MENTVKIPSSIGEVVEKLEGVERLLSATKWERAAIVATFVDVKAGPGNSTQGKTKSIANNGYTLSTYEFAALGITGLSSPENVRRYANAWVAVAKRKRPKPGQDVSLKGLPDWGKVPSTKPESANTTPKVAKTMVKPEQARRFVEAMPAEAQAELVKALIDNEATRSQVTDQVIEDEAGHRALMASMKEQNLNNPQVKAIDAGFEHMKGEAPGRTEWDVGDNLMLGMAGLTLMEWNKGVAAMGYRMTDAARKDALREFAHIHKVLSESEGIARGDVTSISDSDLSALLEG